MKKGDLVKRIKISESYTHDNINVGSSGVIVKGPYEKNITDIFYKENPHMLFVKPRVTEIKRVIDILFEDKIHRFRLVSDYERVKN